MTALATAFASLGPSASVVAQTAGPLTEGARLNYNIVRDYLTRAAEKMPEDQYAFSPTADVRSFGQLIGHLADANYRLCSVVAGQVSPIEAEVEKTMTTKRELVRALDLSFVFCDKQYRAMTDADGTTQVQFEAGGDGNRLPIRMPKLTVLAFHTQHAFEHYGNIVTYMRIKGLVPPSSEPRRRP